MAAASIDLEQLRAIIAQLESDALEAMRLQQRKEELAGAPAELMQLRQDIDEIEQLQVGCSDCDQAVFQNATIQSTHADLCLHNRLVPFLCTYGFVCLSLQSATA